MKAIIVDDESKARENLRNLLTEYCPQVEVIDDCDNIQEAKETVTNLKPDLVFLDVKMQNETGFDLLKQLNQIDFEIIFVTAFDKFAIDAFKFSAIDYIMKPIDIENLISAVKKTEEKMNTAESKAGYEIFRQNLFQKDHQKKIAVPTAEGVLFIKVSDIIRCQADGSYTHIFVNNGTKITVSKILKEYDNLLSDYNFQRVHQSHLINLDHMNKYISAKGGSVEMSDGSTVGVSRNYKESFMQKVSQL